MRGEATGRALLCVLVCVAAVLFGASAARAARTAAGARLARADAQRSTVHPDGSGNRAPGGPPLSSGASGLEVEAPEAQAAGAREAEADPLVSNGLGSPNCRPGVGAELAPSGRHDCETAGFVAAGAPTGNYGIDVHIDTGVLGLSSGGLLSTVQDLLVSPLWMALVWITHALIVMLEWGFSIDLLDSGSVGGLGGGLARAQADLTAPWLPLALSVAAVLTAYRGLVRRKVADTLAEVLLMGAMFFAGMWLIFDPTGTVGALSRWSNQAGLGTLAVAVQGSTTSPGRAFGVSMGSVFQAAIEGPWCYLEFGDVSWCREPSQLDPELHAAALKIAARETQRADCGGAPSCRSGSGAGSQTMLHSGRLLREARTNGALFLALPANGPDRNSINDQGSLLRTICGSQEATSCSGRAGAQAEFRTNSGTWSRLGGLLLITIGLLGMALLLGYIALRLLMAAILGLFYLLLAPGVVLAPAFGEPGRNLFRSWLTRLLGAVLSKLLFAFLLGVVLAVTAVLSDLNGLGWWTQWLLMSAFWWGIYSKRHQLLMPVAGAAPQRMGLQQRSIVRRVGDAVEVRRRLLRTTRGTRRDAKAAPQASEAQPAGTRDAPATAEHDRPALTRLRLQRPERGRPTELDPEQGLALRQAQLERIGVAHAAAVADGETRRAARLTVRGERVSAEIERRRGRSIERREPAAAALQERSALLDLQAGLPRAGRRDVSGRRRDYAALAALVGHSRAEFEQLDPRRQRAARLEIDRELAARRELPSISLDGGAAKTMTAAARAPIVLSQDTAPPAGSSASARRGRGPGPRRPAQESDVMRDARAVAEGRKRRLGFDRE